ncbi:hypothetical protein Lepto7375DRAFT_7310 [Leptolyngbya sp. PCC 7375]|nr:hypothetical protein Lepto7375DRAFT_7310 [Leptolyngbya sp. PCC 7375]
MHQITKSDIQKTFINVDLHKEPDLRFAGVNQGRKGLWLVTLDIFFPRLDIPVSTNIDDKDTEKSILVRYIRESRRYLSTAELVPTGSSIGRALSTLDLGSKLKELRVTSGCIDNEPDRHFGNYIQETTNLILTDFRYNLDQPYKKDIVREAGNSISCTSINYDLFMAHAMDNFISNEDSNPRISIPNHFNQCGFEYDSLSPCAHFMGVRHNPITTKWENVYPTNGLFYALALAEAAFYIWMSERVSIEKLLSV